MVGGEEGAWEEEVVEMLSDNYAWVLVVATILFPSYSWWVMRVGAGVAWNDLNCGDLDEFDYGQDDDHVDGVSWNSHQLML